MDKAHILDKPSVRELNTDFELRSLDSLQPGEAARGEKAWSLLKYGFAGMLFGVILVKSEVISWFRIQEMFRLQSFHMYGVLGSAVVVGILSVWLIRTLHLRSASGEPIRFHPRPFHRGQIYGGLLFGFGWALTGACPGPLFAQIGAGFTVVILTLISAIGGTWVYGRLKDKLPH